MIGRQIELNKLKLAVTKVISFCAWAAAESSKEIKSKLQIGGYSL